MRLEDKKERGKRLQEKDREREKREKEKSCDIKKERQWEILKTRK